MIDLLCCGIQAREYLLQEIVELSLLNHIKLNIKKKNCCQICNVLCVNQLIRDYDFQGLFKVIITRDLFIRSGF